MTYALIGSGNMAWLMASRMLAGGHSCAGVWGRNNSATGALCKAFSLARLTQLSQLNDGPDACIVAVSDAAISEVIEQISFRRTVLIHTAGSVPMGVLSGRSQHTGVVWPVYSIRKDALPVQRGFPAIIEANTKDALEVVRAVAKAICDTAYEASGEQRQWLHLAAVVGNNFVNHLLGIATDICVEKNLPIHLLQPLIAQTIASMNIQHPALTQTGPARRHDAKTIENQLNMLAGHPDWQTLYSAISNAIMARFPLPAEG